MFDLWGQRGWPAVDVVGEQYHKNDIARLLPRQIPEGGAEIELTCQLVPEPQNRHDRNAIRVESEGRLLGYLSRDDAVRYVQVLSRLVSQGLQPQVAGRIWV
jgi:collagen type III alpha